MTYEILLAGFGGQGVLFAGKLLAYCALFEGKEISWLPSYGPEMRGGKCNCSVCISADSSLIDGTCDRTDIDCYMVPATQIADDNGLAKGSNIVLLGKLLAETGIFSTETVRKALEKNTPASRAHTIENNMKAIALGMAYQG